MRRIAMLAALLAACGGGEEGEQHPALGRCFTPPREIVGDGYSGGSLCVPEEWELDHACMRVRTAQPCGGEDDPTAETYFCVVAHARHGDEGETFGLCKVGGVECYWSAVDNPPCCADFFAAHEPGASGECD